MHEPPAPPAKASVPAGGGLSSDDDRLPGESRDSLAPGFPMRPPLGQRVAAYRLLWTLGIVVFVLDQITKFWVAAKIPFDAGHSHSVGTDIDVISGFFYLIHVGNTGAAWSMFSGKSVLLALLAAGTLVAIFFWRHALGLRDRLSQVCFGLLCGGIVGNLLDRLLHGHVIDFIDLHFGSYVYPTFNVADSGICVGVILYLWQSMRAPAGAKSEQTSTE